MLNKSFKLFSISKNYFSHTRFHGVTIQLKINSENFSTLSDELREEDNNSNNILWMNQLFQVYCCIHTQNKKKYFLGTINCIEEENS